MIDRYRISVSKQTSFSTILDKVIITYNSQPHRTIKPTPNEMYNDIDKQNFNFEKDKEYNRNVISKNTISIGYDGRLFDCDFNQQLELITEKAAGTHISEFNLEKLNNRNIIVSQHCFGCTAGAGSSCQGSTV